MRQNYGALSPRDIAAQIDRTKDQVVWRAGVLGVRTPRNPGWTDAENRFLRDNYPTMPDEEISARLGRSLAAIHHQAERQGITKTGLYSDWTEDEDELLGDLYGTMAPDRLADLLGRTQSALTHRAMRLGVNKRPLRPEKRAKPEAREDTILTMRWDVIRHDYFTQIDSPMKAYVLGWLASDGDIKGGEENAVRLRVNVKDEEILHLVRQELAPLHPITPYLGRRPSGEMSSMVRFEVNSAQMKKDLIRLGVTPNKSLTIQYPPIPSELDNSFILGVFDGDGSLGFYGQPGRKRHARWSLFSGSLLFLKEAQRRILFHTEVDVRGPHRKRASRYMGDEAGVWVIAKSGAKVAVLDAWLHADVPGLARKRLPRGT